MGYHGDDQPTVVSIEPQNKTHTKLSCPLEEFNMMIRVIAKPMINTVSEKMPANASFCWMLIRTAQRILVGTKIT